MQYAPHQIRLQQAFKNSFRNDFQIRKISVYHICCELYDIIQCQHCIGSARARHFGWSTSYILFSSSILENSNPIIENPSCDFVALDDKKRFWCASSEHRIKWSNLPCTCLCVNIMYCVFQPINSRIVIGSNTNRGNTSWFIIVYRVPWQDNYLHWQFIYDIESL